MGRVNRGTEIDARPHPFPISFDTCALIIIDMQYDFLYANGGVPRQLKVPEATLADVRLIVPRIQKLIEWARSKEMLVVFTREANNADLSDATDSKIIRYENAGYPIGTKGPMGRLLIKGEPGCQIIDAFSPMEGDIVLDKPCQSIFVATNLEVDLKNREITHLLFTGVTTQCCVLASYRHANDLGFLSLLLEDCCAAFDPVEHEAALKVITSEGGAVGWATTSDHLFSPI